MREQRALGNWPQVLGCIIVRFCHPVVQSAVGMGLHDAGNFFLAPQAVCFQVRNDPQGMIQHIAMGGQNMLDVVLRTDGAEHIKRVQIIPHMPIGRIDHGGAAVQNMVAAEQQAVLDQHQANVVGGVSGRMDDLQGMGQFNTRITLWPA